jgi:CheY-like chemotaxis protein
MSKSAPVVMIVNTNPAIVWMLRRELEKIGFVVVTAHIEEIRAGAVDLKDYVKEHDPRVIVYDVAPPYDDNWRFMDHLRLESSFKGRRFVLTTMNKKRLQEVVGFDETVYEIAGQVEDIDEIVRAVKEASRARSVKG